MRKPHRASAAGLLRAVVLLIALGLSSHQGKAQQASLRTAPSTTPAAAARVSRSNLIDINTATPEQLRALPGMGNEYVRRIIAGRPYSAKNQLVGRGVLPPSAYDRIAAEIIARRSK